MKTVEIIKLNSEALTAHHLGIRFTDKKYKLGSKVAASYAWDYKNDCQSKQKLNGACAINIADSMSFDSIEELIALATERINESGCYSGEYQYIITGDGSEYGNDEHEIIISNAKVIGIAKVS